MDLLRAIVCTAVNQLRFAACDRSTLRWAQSQDSEYVCRMFAVSQTSTSALWVKRVAHWTPWKPSGPGLNPQHFLIPSRCIKALRYVTLSHPSWPLTLKVKGHTSWLAQGRDTTFLWISQAAPFFCLRRRNMVAARRGVTSVKTLGHPGRDLSDCCTELLEFQRGFLSFNKVSWVSRGATSLKKLEKVSRNKSASSRLRIAT